MNMATPPRNSQRGFTLVELMIVMVVAVPILGAITVTGTLVRDEINSTEAAALTAESCRIAGQRLANLARPGLLSTCMVMATQEDVNAAIAAQMLNPTVVVPALGEWISPPPTGWRPSFRFQGADGKLSMNAAELTPVRRFVFSLDAGESQNGVDDDGDGLIDEGGLQLLIGTLPVQLVITGVERCEFRLRGRVLTLVLGVARRDAKGHLYRATTTQSILMRNT
jgi:prepilin-type N-terminal cleavage/methylation domain-containing protein